MKRVLVIISVVVVLALLTVAGILWGRPVFDRVKELVIKEPQAIIDEPRDFTVNLQDPGLRRFLRVRISFEYYPSKALVKELEERNAQVRDTIIGVLRTKAVEDFRTVEDTNALRRELVEKLNEVLQSGNILDLYFVELVVQ